MNSISNIWKHPKTTAAGLLIAIVTIAGVFLQQGITLGNLGSGTVVTFISALATALLGLLAKDPGGAATTTSTSAKLGAWALVALMLPLPFLSGCTGVSVAQEIVNWTPALQSAVATVDTTALMLMPADAPVFASATKDFGAASNLLVAQAKAYLVNPTASALAQMQIQVVALQQSVNAALLQAARIMDTGSQQHALAAIQAVGIIVSAILALVQSVSSRAAIARMAADSTIKLATVRPFMDEGKAAAMVAGHFGEPIALARRQVAQAEQNEMQAGF
jgi:hypothetical protein